MGRVPFSQVLQNASVDILREYERLYELFILRQFALSGNKKITLREICAANFLNLPFRGTCISLDDFDEYYGFRFVDEPADFNLDYLISFCEYSYNLAYYNLGFSMQSFYYGELSEPMQFYVHQVSKAVEAIGYMANHNNVVTDFVPKDPAAISAAEILDSDLSYQVIEYNHHTMKGDLSRKKATLLLLANKLEPQRSQLRKVDPTLETDLFFLLNTVNLRHNNTDPSGKNYIPLIANMEKDALEHWYDETYQMCLLAFLELDHMSRKELIAQLKEEIKK